MKLQLSSAVISVSSETGEIIAKTFENFNLLSFKRPNFRLFERATRNFKRKINFEIECLVLQ
jgi:hypothetical protein